MILVASTSDVEVTTDHVMSWLKYNEADVIRINGIDLKNAGAMRFKLTGDEYDSKMEVSGKELDVTDVNAVWYRRWGGGLKAPKVEGNELLESNIRQHIIAEQSRIDKAFLNNFDDCYWLTRPSHSVGDDKIIILAKAQKAGLSIPPTLVTNRKSELVEFHEEYGTLITKCVGNSGIFTVGPEEVYSMFTAIIDKEDIDKISDEFYHSLFQQKIEKEYELRVFYLEGEFYSMAIFSQADTKTQVDFRHYNWENPNRAVPYSLPDEIEKKLTALMDDLGWNTGSIDLIKTTSGEYCFLEINPVGQFGMVSYPCNYFLERKVAELLQKKDAGKD